MVFTIFEGYDKSYVMIKQWRKNDGLEWKVNTNNLYRELVKIAEYVNNELGEEFLLEVD